MENQPPGNWGLDLPLLALKMKDEATSQEMGVASRSRKSQGSGFSPRSSARNTALLTFWFKPSDTCFKLLTSRTVRLKLCIVLSHGVYRSSNRKPFPPATQLQYYWHFGLEYSVVGAVLWITGYLVGFLAPTLIDASRAPSSTCNNQECLQTLPRVGEKWGDPPSPSSEPLPRTCHSYSF